MQATYRGRIIDVDDVDVLTEKESWNEYQLSDGSVLRIKTNLIRVQKARGEKSPDGTPLYLVRTNQIVDARQQ